MKLPTFSAASLNLKGMQQLHTIRPLVQLHAGHVYQRQSVRTMRIWHLKEEDYVQSIDRLTKRPMESESVIIETNRLRKVSRFPIVHHRFAIFPNLYLNLEMESILKRDGELTEPRWQKAQSNHCIGGLKLHSRYFLDRLVSLVYLSIGIEYAWMFFSREKHKPDKHPSQKQREACVLHSEAEMDHAKQPNGSEKCLAGFSYSIADLWQRIKGAA